MKISHQTFGSGSEKKTMKTFQVNKTITETWRVSFVDKGVIVSGPGLIDTHHNFGTAFRRQVHYAELVNEEVERLTEEYANRPDPIKITAPLLVFEPYRGPHTSRVTLSISKDNDKVLAAFKAGRKLRVTIESVES